MLITQNKNIFNRMKLTFQIWDLIKQYPQKFLFIRLPNLTLFSKQNDKNHLQLSLIKLRQIFLQIMDTITFVAQAVNTCKSMITLQKKNLTLSNVFMPSIISKINQTKKFTDRISISSALFQQFDRQVWLQK